MDTATLMQLPTYSGLLSGSERLETVKSGESVAINLDQVAGRVITTLKDSDFLDKAVVDGGSF